MTDQEYYEDQPESLDLFDDIDDNDDIESGEEMRSMLGKIKRLKTQYCPPDELQKEHDQSLIEGQPTPKLIQFMFMIAKGSSVLIKEINSELDRNSCVIFAVSEMWERKWNKYDENKSTNIFSFYTTVLLNDMRTHNNELRVKTYKHRFLQFENLYLG